MQAITDTMMLKLPDFMAPPNGSKNVSQRPCPIHGSKSFSKLEPAGPDRSTRNSRASTIQNGAISEGDMPDETNGRDSKKTKVQPDAFEKSSPEDEEPGAGEGGAGKLPAVFDELPIELVSLTDRLVLLGSLIALNTNFLQLHRFSICQSPPYSSYGRQVIQSLPRLLCSRCEPYQYPYLCIILSSTPGKLTGCLGISSVLVRDQV